MSDSIPPTAYGDDRCAAEWAHDTDGGTRCEECGGYGTVPSDYPTGVYDETCYRCGGTGEP